MQSIIPFIFNYSVLKNNQGRYDETKFTTTEVHVDTSGYLIRFVKPGTILEQDQPKGNPVHPFFRAVSSLISRSKVAA